MDGFKTKYSGGKSSPIGSPGGAVANQNMKARLKSVKIGTWNARSLFASGKLENVVKEMSRLSINILGISDVRWPGSGKCGTNNGVFYYSGIDDPNHRYGVGVIIDKATNASVQSFTPYSERVMMLQIKTCTGHLNIIQIYAPTADLEEVEVEEFYAELETIIASTKKSDVTIVMGDFNAKVGKDKVEAHTGGYGLDFEKAFDKVRHGVMYRLLDNKGIDAGDIKIISNLYWGQKAAARIENQLTEEIEIRRGPLISAMYCNYFAILAKQLMHAG
ncbi:craniofacial development protein 2-like [Nilaparvata lugens]|uniref:craniofacial development protein 2-like n=1 Tax=Nilaparvata lugens TaxID=108931 RepID=UPI00193E3BAE|nr:craniofacial development protein 2-like [Nilaparvata lugens]